jgi:hypothetical protein
VAYFHTLLQVLILSNLLALNCIKIVQNRCVIHKCGKQRNLAPLTASERKNASEVLALRGQGVIVCGSNYISGVMNCQEEKWRKTERNGSQLLDSIGDLDWVAECCATTMASQRYPELESDSPGTWPINPFKSTNQSRQVSGTSDASKTQSGLTRNYPARKAADDRPDSTNVFSSGAQH